MPKRNLFIVYYFTFLDYVAISIFFGTSIPLLLANIYHIIPQHFPVHNATLYAWALLLLPLGQFVFAPLWGKLADQFGRKPLLFATLGLSLFGYVIMALAIIHGLLAAFFIARFIIAMGAASSVLGQAGLADNTNKLQKTKRFNGQMMMISLSFFVGPYLIDAVTQHQYIDHIYWLLAMGYLLGVIVLLAFTETLALSKTAKRIQIKTLFANKRLVQLFVLWLIFQLGWNLFFQFSGEFLFKARHVSNSQINHIFSWLGIGILLCQAFLVQPTIKWGQAKQILPAAMLLMGTALFVLGFIPVGIIFYALLGVYALSFSFFLTYFNVKISNTASLQQQARALTLMSSTQALAGIVMTFAGNFIVSRYLPSPYVVGGGIILFSGIVALHALIKLR